MQDMEENKTTIMISSHNLRELEDICDTVGIMNEGKLILQRKLDDMKSSVHKVQVAFNEEIIPKDLEKELNILNKSKMGKVYSIIVSGEKEKIVEAFNKYNPLIIDMLPLTLEEIFIYEMGGCGYEVKSIIL